MSKVVSLSERRRVPMKSLKPYGLDLTEEEAAHIVERAIEKMLYNGEGSLTTIITVMAMGAEMAKYGTTEILDDFMSDD